jgi:iron(III) transport system ATP-binding protein
MKITVHQLSKSFGSTPVLRGISLVIPDQQLFFLLGPSGCGKTTLLRLLAGFYPADAGDIRFGDRLMNGVPPHERNIGMVFQNYALWPHLSVAENVAYGLDVRKVSAPEKKQRIQEALEIVQMNDYAQRSPNQLSGGQQQRIALARALVIRPDLLLLDEPLSNLDARLRLEMRDEIRRIHSQTRITTVYVTHDQKEALSLADQIAVLNQGCLEQLGKPADVYRRPANRFVADFIGEANWLEGEVLESTPQSIRLATSVGEFQGLARDNLQPTQAVWVGFRPEAVRFDAPAANLIQCQIAQSYYLGELEEYRLKTSQGIELKAFEQNPAEARATGTMVQTWVHPRDVMVMPR